MRTCKDLTEEELAKVQQHYLAFKTLTELGKGLCPHVCGLLFPLVPDYQWERFLECDRDMMRWFNGMDRDAREHLVIELFLSTDPSIAKYRRV